MEADTSPLPFMRMRIQHKCADADEETTGVRVNFCGHVLKVSSDCLASLSLLTRELTTQLNMNPLSSLQLLDVAKRPIRSDAELNAAVREGRHPLHATSTMVALREIEQQKREAEASKKEMTHIQWQIIADQFFSVSREVSAMTVELHNVRDNCLKSLQQFQEQEVARRDQLLQAVARASAEREACRKDVDLKVERVVQMLNADRSARDVANHQLDVKIDQVIGKIEAGRTARIQEHEETDRALAAIRHDLDIELKCAADHQNSNLEAQRRLKEELAEHICATLSQGERVTQLETETKTLQASMKESEAVLEDKFRTMREELNWCIQNEAQVRQKHLARIMKDIEARMQQARSEANQNQTTLGERTRVLEENSVGLTRNLQHISETQAAQAVQEKSSKKKAALVSTMMTAMKERQKNQDMAIQAMTGNINELQEARLESWKPHLETFQRMMQQHEATLEELSKKCLTQSHLSGVRVRVAEDAPTLQRARFIEVPDVAARSQEEKSVTSRAPFGGA